MGAEGGGCKGEDGSMCRSMWTKVAAIIGSSCCTYSVATLWCPSHFLFPKLSPPGMIPPPLVSPFDNGACCLCQVRKKSIHRVVSLPQKTRQNLTLGFIVTTSYVPLTTDC